MHLLSWSQYPCRRNTRRIASRLLVMVSCLTPYLSGCGRPFDVNTPREFVELDSEESAYDYRATTADGLVVAVRAVDVNDDGSLAFYEKAVTLRLRDVAGYALLESRSVQSEDGTPGRQLRFGHDEHNASYGYWVTLFLAQDRLFLLEAGGPQRLVQHYAPKLEWQIATFRARCMLGIPLIASRTCNRW